MTVNNASGITNYLSVGSMWQNVGFYATLIVLAWIMTKQFGLLKERNKNRQKPF
jgi:hypothetical protein